ncbi:MAG: hypothetical protein II956_15975 [Bacteroidales bacterium]|nr:hypothetical protein [Bacteroidales bacterium]
METEFVSIFQSLAYPVAVSVILFLAIAFCSKKMLEDYHKRDDEAAKLREQYIQYLQMNHIELTAAVRESSSAIKEITQAINRFSMVLEKIETLIHKKD